MAIGNITGTNNMQADYTGKNIQLDSVSKNIQKQISDAQKQLQELSSNEDMTLEEKMKKRQEIQQKIANLNQQLMQHQIEQRKQQQKGSSIDSLAAKQKKQNNTKPGSRANRLSQAGMEAMISAGSSIEQAKIQGGIATKMENRAEILKTEMKYSVSGNTAAKQAELAEIEQKAVNASAMQINTLATAKQQIEEKEQTEEKEEQDKNTYKTGNKTKTGKTPEENTDNKNNTDRQAEEIYKNTGIAPGPVAYKPINISL